MAIQTARRGPVAATRRRLVIPPVGLPVTSGLRSRLKASGITSPPADGAALQTWNDSAGSYPATQNTSALQPLYRNAGAFLPNSKPVVEFVASSGDYMLTAAPGNTATTKFLVVRWKTINNSDLFHTANGYELGPVDGGELYLGADVVLVDPAVNNGTPLVNGVWYIITVRGDGSGNSAIYVNGTLYGTASATSHTISGATGNTAIGSASDGQYPSDLYLADFIDYNRVLTDTEISQVVSALQLEYGFTVNDLTYLDFDFDSSETQAFVGHAAGWESSSAHQHAWLTTPTRLGTGRSERFEIHNNTSDSGTGTYRSLMAVYDTNEGGVAGGSTPAGPDDVYWCFSSYLPTSGAGDANATVSTGFSQTTVPDYEHLFEIHERGDNATPGLVNLSETANFAIMIRSGQLQYRGRFGTFTRTAAGQTWTRPSWNTTTPGTNGSNDQIPIPIVKPGGTNATMVMNAWIDVIAHIKFALDSTGLVEIWARQAGQAFTTNPNLTINGPTHKVLVTGGVTSSTAGYDATTGWTGCYLEVGLYNGSNSWSDGANGAHVHIIDELRRYGNLAAAKANWGP